MLIWTSCTFSFSFIFSHALIRKTLLGGGYGCETSQIATHFWKSSSLTIPSNLKPFQIQSQHNAFGEKQTFDIISTHDLFGKKPPRPLDNLIGVDVEKIAVLYEVELGNKTIGFDLVEENSDEQGVNFNSQISQSCEMAV